MSITYKKKECAVCGDKFPVYDIKNSPATCGKRVCETNAKYKFSHKDMKTGESPKFEDIKKW